MHALRNLHRLAGIAVLAATGLLLGCDAVVTNRYSSRRAAEADRLFERGWLPEIIPNSSRKIVTRNDLDLNTSEGRFAFEPGDSAAFLAHLQKLTAAEAPGAETAKFIERGFWPYAYQRDACRWIFFVHSDAGQCEYRLRSSPTNRVPAQAGQTASQPEQP